MSLFEPLSMLGSGNSMVTRDVFHEGSFTVPLTARPIPIFLQ